MSLRRRPLVTALALFAALGLSACGGILPKAQPMEILQPQVHVTPDPAWPQANWQLAVVRPRGNDMIETARLAVVPTPGRIEVYKGVAWSDSTPEIVQQAMIAAFEDSNRIAAVSRQGNGLRTDFLLQSDLRDYQAVYRTPAGPPEIVLTISVKLVDFASSRVVASRVFTQTQAAAATDAHAVAQAFDAALGNLLHDLVGWTLTQGNQARADAERARKR
ncbi:MAG: membrane integrity-associated transporter subunit PqiC [Proteobacteria bacterium]|nr:membrane integrity-associated transporter subunit PqiC [Pseudomonadota bacterium]